LKFQKNFQLKKNTQQAEVWRSDDRDLDDRGRRRSLEHQPVPIQRGDQRSLHRVPDADEQQRRPLFGPHTHAPMIARGWRFPQQ
jgi:hypothetical protein